MRTVVILLLFANLFFFAFRLLDNASSGEAIRLEEQVQPDKIKLLTPQQVAALGPAKTAALADVCVEWGPFTDGERSHVLAELEPLALGRLLTQKRVETSNAYWVYLPPLATKADADRRANDLKNRGVKDAFAVDNGPQRFAVSLGVFRTEDAAKAHLAELVKLGVSGARAGPRQQPVTLTSLVIRDPPASVVAKLRDLAAAVPNVEFRIGACDKT
jgi:hypothetical protein